MFIIKINNYHSLLEQYFIPFVIFCLTKGILKYFFSLCGGKTCPMVQIYPKTTEHIFDGFSSGVQLLIFLSCKILKHGALKKEMGHLVIRKASQKIPKVFVEEKRD